MGEPCGVTVHKKRGVLVIQTFIHPAGFHLVEPQYFFMAVLLAAAQSSEMHGRLQRVCYSGSASTNSCGYQLLQGTRLRSVELLMCKPLFC
jgi:hypothetical protein